MQPAAPCDQSAPRILFAPNGTRTIPGALQVCHQSPFLLCHLLRLHPPDVTVPPAVSWCLYQQEVAPPGRRDDHRVRQLPRALAAIGCRRQHAKGPFRWHAPQQQILDRAAHGSRRDPAPLLRRPTLCECALSGGRLRRRSCCFCHRILPGMCSVIRNSS